MNESMSSLIVPAVLWALVLFSVVSWALLLIKSSQYLQRKRQDKRFSQAFWNASDLLSAAEHAHQYPGALARIASSGFEAIHVTEAPRTTHQLASTINRADRLERNLRQQIQKERRALESGLAVLASIGSTAPFIGLFGTVWGIMEALQSIGASGSASLETVAGPIGHALIATGVGIAVAVPAVLIYNFFLRRQKLALANMDDFAHDFDALAQRSAFNITRQPISASSTAAVREAS
ncbi:MotA/TolQ/ExbB proton channel family protein [Pseudomonas sp. 5P_3.1_Bac2]|uniref:MotA/TolQ/ExbB proton channel family protein n=1 Tax=Pseudomonas sp. 5P_3.1_Bac2 TaxID=2971617 RepID=UPI0021C6D2E5|nr:MotA/TolQ/ExbB proton channel family protein [Pseudomonas sp. 5P_3.1_Bac2]MCU1717169.1 MotA/TolQ/ExbB proton channel family protein [Pseudomonas sp. 5P_3.1_Bac2]